MRPTPRMRWRIRAPARAVRAPSASRAASDRRDRSEPRDCARTTCATRAVWASPSRPAWRSVARASSQPIWFGKSSSSSGRPRQSESAMRPICSTSARLPSCTEPAPGSAASLKSRHSRSGPQASAAPSTTVPRTCSASTTRPSPARITRSRPSAPWNPSGAKSCRRAAAVMICRVTVSTAPVVGFRSARAGDVEHFGQAATRDMGRNQRNRTVPPGGVLNAPYPAVGGVGEPREPRHA